MAASLLRGVIRDGKTGELVIPASQRSDGSWRKVRRVKDGYVPQDEMPVFETKGNLFLKTMPTHTIGLTPEDCAKMEKAAAEAELRHSQVHTSKAAKKNAKRKGKKHQKQSDGVQNGVSEISTVFQQVTVSKITKITPATDNSEYNTDLYRKIKNMKKKLQQIEELERKIKSGELKNPEKEQVEKISRKQNILQEIEDMELEIEES